MRLTKKEKITDIWTDEYTDWYRISTYNTSLKKRLSEYSNRYSEQCRFLESDEETGRMEFKIRKGRLSFRLTAPYTDERREASRQYANKYDSKDNFRRKQENQNER